MGKIIATIQVINRDDESLAHKGYLDNSEIRAIEAEAFADSGATLLCLKASLIQQLGLPFLEEKSARTTNGVVTRRIYEGAKTTLMGRTATFDVTEVPDDCPNLIGYIPLERLDFVLDVPGQRIIPNPAHDGEFQIDMY